MRNSARERTNYLQINLGHYKPFQNIKKDVQGQMKQKNCDIYCNMLQVEQAQEAGFFQIVIK